MYTVIHTHTTQRHMEHTAPSHIRAITRAHQESKREAFTTCTCYIHARHARDRDDSCPAQQSRVGSIALHRRAHASDGKTVSGLSCTGRRRRASWALGIPKPLASPECRRRVACAAHPRGARAAVHAAWAPCRADGGLRPSLCPVGACSLAAAVKSS